MGTTFTRQVELDRDLAARLDALASTREQPADRLIPEAIEQYVDREERRAAFKRDALSAWSEYEATGLHLTAAEVDGWLIGLEEGRNDDLPECHA